MTCDDRRIAAAGADGGFADGANCGPGGVIDGVHPAPCQPLEAGLKLRGAPLLGNWAPRCRDEPMRAGYGARQRRAARKIIAELVRLVSNDDRIVIPHLRQGWNLAL